LGISEALSCTSRSKIWLPAGEDRRGDEPKPERPGEEGEKCGWSVWMGEAAVRLAAEAFLLMEADLDGDFVASSIFFLPKPNKLRFFDFFSSPSAARGVALPVPGSDADGSVNVGIGGLPWAGAVLAELMMPRL
jgi:hypothetical protein